MNNTKHQLTAAITKAVAATGDSHHVFAVTREVLGEYSRLQNEAMARLVYTASQSAQKNSAFRAGFEKLTKQRDKVLHAINLTRSVFGFPRYVIEELGVWSAPMKVLTGSSVWQACHTVDDAVAILAADPDKKKMMLAWGRVLTHGDEGAAAAALLTPEVEAEWVKSILAVGAALRKKEKMLDKLVTFKDGEGVEWAVKGYEAVTKGGKPGDTLRGVSDAIKVAINASFFAQRNAEADPVRHVASGHKEAWYLLREDAKGLNWQDGQRQGLRPDEDVGQEAYAGADDIIVRMVTGKEVNLGNCIEAKEFEGIITGIASDWASKADDMLVTARAMFERLSCGVKEGDFTFTDFDELKRAIYARLAEGQKVRAEAKARNKALERALIAVEAAADMDAVSRRVFLKSLEDLPLADAVEAMRVQRAAEAEGEAKRLAQAEKEAAEAAALAVKEAAYAATAARAAEWEAGAEARKAKHAELARKEAAVFKNFAENAKDRPAEYEFVPADRETLSTAQYRAILTEGLK